MNASEAALTEKNSPNTQERRKNSKSSNLKRVNSSGSVEEDEKTPPQVLRERSVSEVLENKINVESSSPNASSPKQPPKDFPLSPCSPYLTKVSVIDVIKKDLRRTFPENPFFNYEGQNQLKKVLLAYAGLHEEVGYCQGRIFFDFLKICSGVRVCQECKQTRSTTLK